MEAVWNHQLRHLSLLIAAGADVNFRDEDGRTPSAVAAWNGDTEALQLLLQAGAAKSINLRDREEGITPLHAAVIVCREHEAASADNVFCLLAAGADANIPDCDGWSPLHSCAFYRLPQLIPALLAAGAIPTLRNRQGFTPADMAKEKGFDDIVILLSGHVS